MYPPRESLLVVNRRSLYLWEVLSQDINSLKEVLICRSLLYIENYFAATALQETDEPNSNCMTDCRLNAKTIMICQLRSIIYYCLIHHRREI